MKNVTILKNEKGQLFTLENYDKVACVSHPNNIIFDREVDKATARAMHERGQLHYVFGIGDRKVLTGKLRRGKTYGNFKVK